jgi:hypothetical protein
MWWMLALVAHADPVSGPPDTLLGFDALGVLSTFDLGDTLDAEIPDRVTGKLDEILPARIDDKLDTEFPDRADRERDGLGFREDVESISIDVAAEIVPDLALAVCEDAIADLLPGLVVGAIPVLPAFDFGGEARVSWFAATGATPGSSATGASNVVFLPHVEEMAARTYDGVSIWVTATSAVTTRIGIYSLVNGKPGDLLWAPTGTLSASSTGEKRFDFSADGAQTSAGIASGLFDVNGDLSLVVGDAIVLAEQHSGNMSHRTIPVGSQRALAVRAATAGAPYVGWSAPNNFAGGGLPGSGALATPDQASNQPLIMLDPL